MLGQAPYLKSVAALALSGVDAHRVFAAIEEAKRTIGVEDGPSVVVANRDGRRRKNRHAPLQLGHQRLAATRVGAHDTVTG